MDCGFHQGVVVHVDVAEAEAVDIVEAAAVDIVAVDDAVAHCLIAPCCSPSYWQRQRIRGPSGKDSYSDDHPRLDESLAWKCWVVAVVVVAVVGVPMAVGLLVQTEAAADRTVGEMVVEPVDASADSDDSSH
jgi:hypothetical protein